MAPFTDFDFLLEQKNGDLEHFDAGVDTIIYEDADGLVAKNDFVEYELHYESRTNGQSGASVLIFFGTGSSGTSLIF